MKLFHLICAAGLLSFSAATAQTTPSATPPGTGTAAPSAVPSGMPAAPSTPNGAVSAGEVFTTGAPTDSSKSGKRATKQAKNKAARAGGKGKTKTKM